MEELNNQNNAKQLKNINKPVKPVKPTKPVKPGQLKESKQIIKTQEQHVTKTQNKPNIKREQPIQNSVQKSVQKPVQKPEQRPLQRPVQKLTQQSVQRIEQSKNKTIQKTQINRTQAQRQQTQKKVMTTGEQVTKEQLLKTEHTQHNNNKINSTLKQEENISLARKTNLTRLQRQSNNIQNRNKQDINKQNLFEKHDYILCNDNKESFEVKKTKKQQGNSFLLLPIAVIILLAVIILIVFGSIMSGIEDINVKNSGASLLNAAAIDKEQFIETVKNKNLQIDEKELSDNIEEVMSYTDDYTYEIDYITFDNNTDAQVYYNYIIDEADEKESSVSSSILGQNSAETTLISNTYNSFMDITYIDNTIIIGLAYDSNEQDTVISIMNSLGY